MKFDDILSALKPEQWLWFGEQAEKGSADIHVDCGRRKQQLGMHCVFRIAEKQPGDFGGRVAAIVPVFFKLFLQPLNVILPAWF